MPPTKTGRTPPPPTAGDVIALFNTKQADGNEARLRALAETFRVLTRLEHEIRIPDAYKATTREMRTPYVRDAWQRITAALSQNDWNVHFDPKTEADNAKRAAGIAERWVKAGCQEMDKAIGFDVPQEACSHMVRDTESVIKVVHRPEAWATFPVRGDEHPDDYQKKAETYKKGSPFPFAWRTLDRLSYLPGDGEFGDEWCVEYGEYPRPYLAQRYGMREDPDTGRLVGPGHEEEGRTVRPRDVLGGRPAPQGYYSGSVGSSVKLEYFDCYHWCVVIDGSMAPDFPRENPYAPWLPYFRAKPSDEPESVLYSLLFLVPRLDEVLTMWLNWAHLSAFPTPLLQDLPNSSALPAGMLPPLGQETGPSTFTWKPGRMLEVPRGKAFLFQQPPPAGGDLEKLALILRSLIDVAGIPSILRGGNLSGDSGYLANQMIAAATMLYKKLQRARERQLESVSEFLLHFSAHTIRQTVYVLGQGEEGRSYLGVRATGETTPSLAPIDKLGPVAVNAPPDMSVMRQAMAMIAKQLTEGPPESRLMSRRAAMEDLLGLEDPDTMIDEIWVEDQMATNPAVNELVVSNAVRQSGLMPTPAQNPAAALVGPNGQPLVPGGLPGQVAGGLPVMPGMGMPMQPPAPGGGMVPGPQVSGVYPGQPPQPPVAPMGGP